MFLNRIWINCKTSYEEIEMKQSKYLLSIFLMLFLSTFLCIAHAENEYVSCFYPPKGMATHLFMYAAESIPSRNTTSPVQAKIFTLDSQAGIISSNDVESPIRIEETGRTLSGINSKTRIRISWTGNSYLDIEFENDKFKPTNAVAHYGALNNVEVSCIINNSRDKFTLDMAAYGAKALGHTVVANCKKNSKALIGLGILGAAGLAYYCGAI